MKTPATSNSPATDSSGQLSLPEFDGRVCYFISKQGEETVISLSERMSRMVTAIAMNRSFSWMMPTLTMTPSVPSHHPAFLPNDYKTKLNLDAIAEYRKQLNQEIKSIRPEYDRRTVERKRALGEVEALRDHYL